MRRSLALFALIAIPLSACGTSSIASSGQLATSSVTVSPGAATTGVVTAVLTPGPASAGVLVQPAGSTVDQPDPSMLTGVVLQPSSEVVAVESPAAPTVAGVTVMTAGSDFGQILFDGTGQAIYLFDKESTAIPDCYNECAVAWPPVLTEGFAVAGAGTMTDLLGSTPRSDGSTQVTYAGHPLYYYANEGKNEVTCHNVSEFGGLWLVVTPTGQAAA